MNLTDGHHAELCHAFSFHFIFYMFIEVVNSRYYCFYMQLVFLSFFLFLYSLFVMQFTHDLIMSRIMCCHILNCMCENRIMMMMMMMMMSVLQDFTATSVLR